MKKLNLSRFDLGMIIAFAVVMVLGGGAWWYLSGQLQSAQDDVHKANQAFVTYSSKYSIVVSPSNEKNLQANINLLKAQIEPLIETKLLSKDNQLGSIEKEDPVAWKQKLNNEVHQLGSQAKVHGVTLPPIFYFGFSRYVSQSPNDQQTVVLSKQLMGIKELATILINAPVKGIEAIRRTYEEEPHTGAGNTFGPTEDPDRVPGYAITVPGNAYTAYPFEIDFEATTENLRPIINNLIQSPYVFIIRSLSIENSSLNSPRTDNLDQLAGPPAPSVTDTSPGEVAAIAPMKGPQKFFGYSMLKIKARIDMIEWKAEISDTASGAANGGPNNSPLSPGGTQ